MNSCFVAFSFWFLFGIVRLHTGKISSKVKSITTNRVASSRRLLVIALCKKKVQILELIHISVQEILNDITFVHGNLSGERKQIVEWTCLVNAVMLQSFRLLNRTQHLISNAQHYQPDRWLRLRLDKEANKWLQSSLELHGHPLLSGSW